MFDTLDIRSEVSSNEIPTIPLDTLEQVLFDRQAAINRLHAEQLVLLRALDAAQVPAVDGARSMIEWTSARLDVTRDTATTLVRTAHIVADHPHLEAQLASGTVTIERVLETAKLAAAGADPDTVDRSFGLDLAGLRRLRARHRRMTRSDETKAFTERFYAHQTTLDGTTGRFWGQLPAFELSILNDAIDHRADMFGDLAGPTPQLSARRADALVSIAQDTLDPGTGTGTSADQLVTVFVDATLATPTRGEAGAEIAFGAKIGPATLERILCSGAVQVIATTDQGLVSTHATRAIPPATRRYVIWRDGGCTIDGCQSRYRLEPHHIQHRQHGGDNHPNNLTTLCWYHHHIIIHNLGHQLDPHTPPGKRRYLTPPPRAPNPTN